VINLLGANQMYKNRELWSINDEKMFFSSYLKITIAEKLFYKLDRDFYAYIPKGFDSKNQTLQSRNALIGLFTEKWCRDLFSPVAQKMGLYAINSVVCEEIGLTQNSPADLAFCTNENIKQDPENIKLIFEIKMSIIWNYLYNEMKGLSLLGDYKTHKGNPSLLRSDSMLKAIGKSINIRVSGNCANKIPIVIIGNSPITSTYLKKVDYLKTAGVIQGFWSLNPNPSESDFIQSSPELGFKTFKNISEITKDFEILLNNDYYYISTMLSKPQIGKYISIASQEKTDTEKAEKFIKLLRGKTW
jgi:proteasome lid subunit RPN8/RPN11